MSELSNLQLTIDFDDPNWNEQQKAEIIRNLQQEMREMEGFVAEPEDVELKRNIRPQAIGSFLTGILMAEVNPANIKRLLSFLSERLGNKAIKLRLKTPDGRELEVEASSKEEFEYIIAQAERFINQQA